MADRKSEVGEEIQRRLREFEQEEGVIVTPQMLNNPQGQLEQKVADRWVREAARIIKEFRDEERLVVGAPYKQSVATERPKQTHPDPIERSYLKSSEYEDADY